MGIILADVRVGQVTVGEDGDNVRNGVTVILPRHPDDIHVPSYAGLHTLNGNGEVTGSYQIRDWGFINTVCLVVLTVCLVSFLMNALSPSH